MGIIIRVVFTTIFLVNLCASQNDGGCDLDQTDAIWTTKLYINWDDTNTDPYIVNITSGKAEVEKNDAFLTFFTIENNAKQIVFGVNDKFKNLEANRDSWNNNFSIAGDFLKVKGFLDIVCNGGTSKLEIQYVIQDINTHSPTFKTNSYPMTLAMPIMPGLNLTYSQDQIVVTDLDFSTKDLTVTTDPRFTVQTETWNEFKIKTVQVSLIAKEKIDLSDPESLTMTVSDGDLTGTAELVITPDLPNSYDTPSFTNSLYKFQIVNGKLQAEDGDITINTNRGTITEDQFTLESDLLTLKIKGKVVTISPRDPTSLTEEYYIKITYKSDASTSSIIYIYSQQHKSNIFDNTLYSADFDLSKNAESIEVTNNLDGSYKITLDGDDKIYFQPELTYDDKNKVWTITVLDPLPEDLLQKTNQLVVNLMASLNGNDAGQSVLKITLPTPSSFSQTSYVGSYKTKSIQLVQEISMEDTKNSYDFSITSSDINGYSFSLNSDQKTITVNPELDSSVLKKSSISLTITSRLNSLIQDSVDIFVSLPGEKSHFEEDVYRTTYKEKTLVFNPEILIVPIVGSGLTLSIADFKDLITPNYDKATGKCTLTPKEDFSATSTISTTLTATLDDGTTFSTAIIIDIPDPLEFKNLAYLSTYDKASNQIKLKDPISVTNYDATKITLTVQDFDKYSFEVTDLSTITPKTPLDDLLGKQSSLILTIVGLDSATSSQGKATIVVDLKEATKTPQFEQNLYTGSLSKKDGTFSEDIKIVPAFDSNPTLTISDGFDQYFQVTYDSGICTLKLFNDLSSFKEVISFTLQATLDSVNTYTGIIVNLPTAPEFTRLDYSGTYDKDSGTIVLINKIETKPFSGTITIKIDDFNSYQFTLSGDHLKVTLNQPLSDDILTGYPNLVLTLSAYDSDYDTIQGKATLVVNLPKTTEDWLEFNSDVYSANYDLESKLINLNDPIEFTNVADQSKITISVDTIYSDYLEVKFEDNKWKINVKKPLEDTSKNLIVTLTAHETDSLRVGTVKLLVIPLDQSGIAFTQISYHGSYQQEGLDNPTVKLDANIAVTSNSDKVKIELDEEFQKYFELSCTKTDCSVTVKNAISDINIARPIITSLKATLDSKTASAGLIITLPEPNPVLTPRFSDSYYMANYITSEPPSITSQKNILIDNVDSSNFPNIIMTSSDYSEYFQPAIDLKSGLVNIEVLQPLPSKILTEENSLITTLVASLNGQLGYTTLVVILPTTTSKELHFEELKYSATCKVKENGLDDFEVEEIKFKSTLNDNTKFDVNLEGFPKNFKASIKDDKVTVALTENLSNDLREKYSVITLKVTVSTEGFSADTILIVEIIPLPGKSDGDDSQDKDKDDCESRVVYTAVIIVLSVLLAAYIAATVAFYILKVRGKRQVLVEEEEMPARSSPLFVKHSSSKISHISKSPEEKRRSTGFLTFPSEDNEDSRESITDKSDEDMIAEVTKHPARKSVVFDEIVEEVQIEKTIDDEEEPEDNVYDEVSESTEEVKDLARSVEEESNTYL